MDILVRVWASVPGFRRFLSDFIRGFRTLARTRTEKPIGVGERVLGSRHRWTYLSEFERALEIP